MLAAIYARMSSELQNQTSIDAQIRACTLYCEKKGYTVLRHYVDEAKSGRSDERPAFQSMIEAAKQSAFNVVVCHKIDRFSRDRYDHSYYKRILQKKAISLEYADQNIDDSPEGQLTESILIGLSEYYSKNLAKESMKGLNERAHRSLFNGGVPPLGYDVSGGEYIINQKEAEAVKLIFEMYAAGHGYNTISRTLNEQGFAAKRGGRFGKNSLHDILLNQKYIGIYQFGKVRRTPDGKRNSHKNDDKAIKGTCPQIISNELWEKVQKMMQENKRTGGRLSTKREYLLSGLIKCKCGFNMVGRWVPARGKSWYVCGQNNRKPGSCDCKQIATDRAEELVMATVNEAMTTPEGRREICSELNRLYSETFAQQNASLDAWESEIKGLRQKQAHLLNALEEGILPESGKERLREYAQREKILAENIGHATRGLATIHPAVIEKQIAGYEQAVKENDTLAIRASLRIVVDSIVWDGENITTLIKCAISNGAEGRTRTGTPSLTADFESAASANSATSAHIVALTGK